MNIIALLKLIPMVITVLVSIVQGFVTIARLLAPIFQMMFSKPREQKTITIEAPGKSVTIDRPPLTSMESPTVDVVHKPPTPEELQALKEKEEQAERDVALLHQLRVSGSATPQPEDGPSGENDVWVQADPQKGIKEGHWKSKEKSEKKENI